MLGTYVPTPCGIATFAAALTRGLESLGASVSIVRVADPASRRDARVVTDLAPGSRGSRLRAARALDAADLSIVQHEYGIYGGRDGAEVLDVLCRLTRPPVVVAHTVLQRPTDHERWVLEQVADSAGVVVVMSEWARKVLAERFSVDDRKVVVVPHGARYRPVHEELDTAAHPLLVTWGLLGPGKGIECVLDALVTLRELGHEPDYLVAGRTHPKVVAREGERYRRMLEHKVSELDLGGQVRFDDSYRSLEEIDELIDAASVVILPYDSLDQVTSGVLVDAVAGGCPVVATAFPHAIELLACGAGSVVPRKDPSALAAELARLLGHPALLAGMRERARVIGPSLSWSSVASQYLELASMRTRRHVRTSA